MKYVKLFEDFLNEGAIPVFPPGDPYNREGSIQWTGVVQHTKKWMDEGQSFYLVADLDYDKWTADPQFRSESLGTWKNKELPLFTSKYPKYKEVEFDMLGVVDHPEKPNEPWIRVVDKKGFEFLIPPFRILDIQKGGSVRDGIYAGFKYLIDGKRGKVTNYKDDLVYIQMQDGGKKVFTIEEWKKSNFHHIDEKEIVDETKLD